MAGLGITTAARRSPSWPVPRAPAMAIHVLRRFLPIRPAPRSVRPLVTGQAYRPVSVWEGQSAAPVHRFRRAGSLGSTKAAEFLLRQVCAEAGSGRLDCETERAGHDAAAASSTRRSTFIELCDGVVPRHLLEKAEAIGFKYPTQTQEESLPVLMSGVDCLLQAQTGSGKTLAYMMTILAKLVPRSSVQAIIVVPTRELGMQVAKVARSLMGKSSKSGDVDADGPKGALSVMTLLDGGSASRQKRWIKAAPPQLIVGTLRCISRLIDSNHLKTHMVTTMVIDEVDTLLGAAKEGNLLQNLLTVHTQVQQRQTIFASATVPQHTRFVRDCIQNRWAKANLVHVHVSPQVTMPRYLLHRYVVCNKNDKLQALVSVLNDDKPRAAIIFVNESEKAKRSGQTPSTSTTAEFLIEMISQQRIGEDDSSRWEPLILEEDDHINQRTSTLSDFRDGRCLLVATDLAARGLDLPEVSHVYNIDLPPNVTSYIHRAGRTGRRPIEEEQGTVTNFIVPQELFVLRRIENESHATFSPLPIAEPSVP